ncbi:MAG: hypothetical protein WAZ12_02940 [Candidatus Absconditicoccaceae bacterium]
MIVNNKETDDLNVVEIHSTHFNIEKIRENLKATMEFEDFKTISPRALYHEPFEDLLSSEQKLYLMDNGIINCNPATKEEKKETYKDHEESPYPGINRKLDNKSIYHYVSQGSYGIEEDILLNSDGFSQCHAVIVYNPVTCSAMLLHVVGRDFDDEQIGPLEEFVKDANCEAIFIYGSESRCLPKLGHEILARFGCRSSNIFVSTGPYHRGLSYDPSLNKFFVARKNPPDCDVLTFPGFSSDVYDIEKRKIYNIEKRTKKLYIEAMHTVIYRLNDTIFKGFFPNNIFENILNEMEKILGKKFDRKEFIDYCIDNNEIMFDQDKVVVPSGFRYAQDDYESIYARYGYKYNEVDYNMSFLTHISEKYYKHLLIWLTKHGYKFLEGNRSASLFLDSEGREFIFGCSGEKVNFRFIGDWNKSQKQEVINCSYVLFDFMPEAKKQYRDSFSGFKEEDID